jgi:Alw26I/Eco31I/Esp3I family type II restriction m6 adenine DNA methyltransferase
MLDFVSEATTFATEYAGKTLGERLAGRFFTPNVLGEDLANQIATLLEAKAAAGALGTQIRITDPFCGDGRLVLALVETISRRPALRGRQLKILLCDIEHTSVENATKAVKAAAAEIDAYVRVRGVVRDSFAAAIEPNDVVITNPPWELIKPDTRELSHMSAQAKGAHCDDLRALCYRLDGRFPDAKGDGAWGGWGTNLARCGWDLSIRLCASGGVLGIVLPSTVLADQASIRMRRAAFRRTQLIDLATYPSEARLFERVDQPVVVATFLVKAAVGINAALRIFDKQREVRAQKQLTISESELEAGDYTLPVGFGAEATELLGRFSALPRLTDFESDDACGLWTGRELDETRIVEKTVHGIRYSPFVKGRMIRRHAIDEHPTTSVRPALAGNFRSAQYERVVWRDVSRSSQKRRMIGAIIPAGWIAGNSLHVAYFRNGDSDKLHALHAVLSSLALEFQVRSRLATGHMSLGVVRSARVPDFSKRTVATLSALARAALKSEMEHAPKLEVAVARAYGLSRDEMADLMTQFPKMDLTEREAVLDRRLWGLRSST